MLARLRFSVVARHLGRFDYQCSCLAGRVLSLAVLVVIEGTPLDGSLHRIGEGKVAGHGVPVALLGR